MTIVSKLSLGILCIAMIAACGEQGQKVSTGGPKAVDDAALAAKAQTIVLKEVNFLDAYELVKSQHSKLAFPIMRAVAIDLDPAVEAQLDMKACRLSSPALPAFEKISVDQLGESNLDALLDLFLDKTLTESEKLAASSDGLRATQLVVNFLDDPLSDSTDQEEPAADASDPEPSTSADPIDSDRISEVEETSPTSESDNAAELRELLSYEYKTTLICELKNKTKLYSYVDFVGVFATVKSDDQFYLVVKSDLVDGSISIGTTAKNLKLATLKNIPTNPTSSLNEVYKLKTQ